jgi:glycosyltransferase involved in cell wall biosynthesis
MRILFLTQILPYPPDAGPRVKSWHVLRYLIEQGHEVTLVAFVRSEEAVHLPALQQYCAAVHTVPIRRSRLADGAFWLRSHLRNRPFLVERDDLRAMRRLVSTLVAGGRFDVLHADQLTMAQFGLAKDRRPSQKRPALLFDAHNAVWTIVERLRPAAPLALRTLLALEARRIKSYEGWVVREYDHTLAVTEPDRQALLAACDATRGYDPQRPPAITVVPITVDAAELTPVPASDESANILTLGTLHYPPNADGIRWFVEEVFPLVRQNRAATLTIVGKNPPAELREAAGRHPEAIELTGYAPRLEPYLARAALMVVPVRAGGGMRVRILEAFARGKPVVTTTVGLEGIEAQPGRDVLVADRPADFAAAVSQLLGDPGLRRELGNNGRRLVESRYDRRIALGQMDAVYESLANAAGHHSG